MKKLGLLSSILLLGLGAQAKTLLTCTGSDSAAFYLTESQQGSLSSGELLSGSPGDNAPGGSLSLAQGELVIADGIDYKTYALLDSNQNPVFYAFDGSVIEGVMHYDGYLVKNKALTDHMDCVEAK